MSITITILIIVVNHYHFGNCLALNAQQENLIKNVCQLLKRNTISLIHISHDQIAQHPTSNILQVNKSVVK